MTAPQPIEIIGGGLAGLSLGVALRCAGIEVSVLEAGAYPRHRVCGEFITGLPAATRRRLGLDPVLQDALHHREVAWFARGELIRRQRLPSPALGLSRHALDARLAERFVRLGGKLHTNTRSAARDDAPGRVFATGRRPARSAWIGLKIHALALPLAADLELHPGDAAYIGLTKVGVDRVNLCGLFRRQSLRGHGVDLIIAYLHAAGLGALAHRLSRVTTDPDSFCAVAAIEFDWRVASSGPLRIGDACALIPPFTGHGMAMAFQSAELALEPLIAFARGAADWMATRASIHRALRRRFRLRLASAGLLHPFLLRRGHRDWFEWLNRSRLLPFRPLYALLH